MPSRRTTRDLSNTSFDEDTGILSVRLTASDMLASKGLGYELSRRLCRECGRFCERAILTCQGCKRARYCSRECQRAARAMHKPVCRPEIPVRLRFRSPHLLPFSPPPAVALS